MGEIFIFNIAKLAVKSIITTASTYPKPGLITPIDDSALNNGADFHCFVDGAMSLFQCFVNCAAVGIDTANLKPEDAFIILQSPAKIGLCDVFRATDGKIIMKGFVFNLGLLSAAAGRLITQKRILTPSALALTASSFVRGIIQRELWTLGDTDRTTFTSGEKAWLSYGFEGCRGEAEHGFKNTLKALEVMREVDNETLLTYREKCAQTLIQIMAEINDTGIAARGGIQDLEYFRTQAENIIKAGGMYTNEGVDQIFDFDNKLRSKCAAPTGSTVILASALFISELVNLKLTRSGYNE